MTCDKCGREVQIGEHPFCPHGFPMRYQPFRAFFDIALGEQVNSLADWNKAMRKHKADMTDGLSKGDLSARKDKQHAISQREAQR